MGPSRHLVIFAKLPVIGQVKSRLARDIGAVRATQWYRHTLMRLVRRLGRDQRWTTTIAVAPDSSVPFFRCWLDIANVFVVAQGPGDLGERMGKIFKFMSKGPVVLIGSDIPAVAPEHVERAFRALGHADVVFGPSTDGGYWLVGQKRLCAQPQLFDGVPWSSAGTLEKNIQRVRGRVAFVDLMTDVDRAADLLEPAS